MIRGKDLLNGMLVLDKYDGATLVVSAVARPMDTEVIDIVWALLSRNGRLVQDVRYASCEYAFDIVS